jgi:hypothetical protein
MSTTPTVYCSVRLQALPIGWWLNDGGQRRLKVEMGFKVGQEVRKTKRQVNQLFKLAKKIKGISKWLHSSCYDSPISEKKRRQIIGIFCRQMY